MDDPREIEITTEAPPLVVITPNREYKKLSFVFLLFGLAILAPWTVWIQQNDLFQMKTVGTVFGGTYEGWITVIFQIFNISALLVLISYPKILTFDQRINGGLFMIMAIFFLGIILSIYVEGLVYFVLILLLVGLSAIAGALLAAFIGLASDYPSYCMTVFNSGQGLSAVIPTLTQLVLTKQSPLFGTVSCFVQSVLICVGALFAYRYIIKLREIEYRPIEVTSEESTALSPLDESHDVLEDQDRSMWDVFQEIKILCLSVFLNLFITLSIFPAITTSVQDSTIPRFVLWHFLIYNLADFIGKFSTIRIRFSTQKLLLLTLARFIFIPLILCCNVVLLDNDGLPLPRALPVLFNSSAYFFILALFAFSNGLLTTSSFVNSSTILTNPSPKTLGLSGDLMQLSLTVGLTLGSITTFILQSIMTYYSFPF